MAPSLSGQAKTLETWLDQLATLHPLTMDFTHDRIATVYQRLNLEPIAPLIITVAGTNGKGSTATTTATLLKQHGAKVGLFTSPHLFRFNERIKIDLIEADDEAIIEAFEAIESARGAITLTYFEYATLAAFYLFKRAAVDVAVLEVGLGGRLDSTTIVDADIAIITPIDIDHTAQLGNSIDTIAAEKAGIIKQRSSVITAESAPSPAIIAQAKRCSAPLLIAQQSYHYHILQLNDPLSPWHYQYQEEEPLLLQPPKLMGRHQYQNSAAALTALQLAQRALTLTPITAESINQGLDSVELLGRLQRLEAANAPRLYLDVTHNPQGAAQLAKVLSNTYPNRRIVAIYGALVDKDAKAVTALLKPLISHWYLAPISDPRGESATALQKRVWPIIGMDSTPHNSIEAACEKALSESSKDDIILLFGSFHMINSGYSWFKRNGYAES